MYKLPIYFVSDNHFKMNIDESEIKRRKKLFHVFEKVKETEGTLVIGGDFFDFWFNYKYVIPSGYNDIIEKLTELKQSGINIHYVLGNHDYWDFGFFNKKFNAYVYQNDLEFTNKDAKIIVTHGDGLLKNDRGYRLMKKIIRSRLCIFLFKNFHPDWGCSLAERISKTSGHYHHHDKKYDEIRNELIEFGRKKWTEGINTVLFGHYHQTGIIEENGKQLIFMGDWLKHFTVTRLDNDGWWQGNWKEI